MFSRKKAPASSSQPQSVTSSKLKVERPAAVLLSSVKHHLPHHDGEEMSPPLEWYRYNGLIHDGVQSPTESDMVTVGNLPAHNAASNTTSSVLLTSLICLCALDTSKQESQMVRVVSMEKLLVPHHERIVREALRRHMEWHLWCEEHNNKSYNDTEHAGESSGGTNNRTYEFREGRQNPTSSPKATVVVDAVFLKSMDMDQVDTFCLDCLRQHNYLGALAILKVSLTKLPLSSNAQRADTLSKLAILCLILGRSKEALECSTCGFDLHQANARPLEAAVSAMEVGLVHFSTHKVSKARKSWRESMQLACLAVGYEHSLVGTLLCNIGVLHYESGDWAASIRTLEESLEVQRSVLRLSVVNAEYALFKIATTMGNLAMAFESNKQNDRAVKLLDESLSMLGSLFEAPVVKEMEELVSRNLQRLVATSDQAVVRSSSKLVSENDDASRDDDDDDASLDSTRSSILFGNSDGIPGRRVAAVMSMEESDNHDFILLGRLHPPQTCEARVRETVLTWFGRELFDGSVSFVAHHDDEREKPAMITVDLDNNGIIADAEVHLGQIHLQAMKYLDRGKVYKALDLFYSALRSHEIKFGEKHHLVGNALHNIGMVHLFAQQYSDALVVFTRAVRVRRAALGPDHPDVQASRMKIALIRLAKGDYRRAQRTFLQIRDKFLKVLGYGHPQMAKILNNIGVMACEMEDYATAHKSFESAYQYQRNLAEDMEKGNEIVSLTTANTLSNMAFVYFKEGKMKESLQLYQQALSLQKDYLDPDDPRLVMLRRNMKHIADGFPTLALGDCFLPNPICMMDKVFGPKQS